MTEPEIVLPGQAGALLVHPDYKGLVSEGWFDPLCWGRQARLVGSGGRGNAWFIEINGAPPVVLRWYRRGGLIARLSESSYVYMGARRVRSFTEFRLLNTLFAQGFPVPKPVAAQYRRIAGLCYRAGIMTEQIADAVPLGDMVGQLDPEAWGRLGGMIRRFHDANVFHADLNCFNILMQGEKFFLIDFDKGRIVDAGQSAGWKQANLSRLVRSLRKVADAAAVERAWTLLLQGYQRSQPL